MLRYISLAGLGQLSRYTRELNAKADCCVERGAFQHISAAVIDVAGKKGLGARYKISVGAIC